MSVDFGMKQSLIEAGLVDPSSGAFLSEPNFGAPPEADVPRDPLPDLPDDAPGDGERAQPQPNQKPASQPQVVETPSAPSGHPDPGDQGPPPGEPQHDPRRLGEASDPVRQQYDQGVMALRQQAREAFLIGRQLTDQEGNRVYSDQELEAKIGQNLALMEHQMYLAGVMERMQPVAKRAAAEKMAKDYGVDVEDIINEPNPIAMETRAKTIHDLMRDGRFQRRRDQGVDTAEGSRSFSNAIPEAIDKLSPQQKMYVGLARGDR
jgi:hypothetical protein